MSKTYLIGEEQHVQIPPTLACAIGLNEAIVVQHVHWLCNLPKSGKVIDGEKWVYNTYEEWQKDWFPWWSIDTIQRIFRSLEERMIIISCQPEGKKSRRKYYRINQGAKEQLTFENYHDGKLRSLGTGQVAVILEDGKLRSSLNTVISQQSLSNTKSPRKKYLKRNKPSETIDCTNLIEDSLSRIVNNSKKDDGLDELDENEEY